MRLLRIWLPVLALVLLAAPPVSSRPEKIVVAFGEAFPPMAYRENGRPAGADVEIWRRWSEETGVAVEFRLMPWPEAIPALLRGDVDVVDGVSRTADREADLDFSSAYGELRSYIYHDAQIDGPLDLDDLRRIPTGVLAGTDMEEYVRGAAREIRLYRSPTELLEGIRRDEIDAFVCVDLVTEWHQNRIRSGEVVLSRGLDALRSSLLHMAVREGEADLLALVNEGLAKIPEEERHEIFERWTGVSMGVPPDLSWLFWLGGAVLIAAALLFTWNAVLQRKFRRATREIREQELRFRELIESTSDWIWEVDTASVYTYVGPTVRELLGYEPEEMLGRTPYDLMPIDEARRVRRIVAPMMEQGRLIENIENRNLHKDGRAVLLETSGVPIRDGEGRVVGYRGVDRDITERKSLEAQLAHSQKMEAIGQLAGGVAHDFNNQLQAILGYTHLLQKQDPPSGAAKSHLQEIRRATERSAALTKQLLTFGRR
ncbi:MAG: transporter substrate-binding domain-containing protein, partial [Planctomycetota bacterium]